MGVFGHPLTPPGPLAAQERTDPAQFRPGAQWSASRFATPSLPCAVERRCVPAGANPARQLSLQPEAVGAVQGGNEMH